MSKRKEDLMPKKNKKPQLIGAISLLADCPTTYKGNTAFSIIPGVNCDPDYSTIRNFDDSHFDAFDDYHFLGHSQRPPDKMDHDSSGYESEYESYDPEEIAEKQKLVVEKKRLERKKMKKELKLERLKQLQDQKEERQKDEHEKIESEAKQKAEAEAAEKQKLDLAVKELEATRAPSSQYVRPSARRPTELLFILLIGVALVGYWGYNAYFLPELKVDPLKNLPENWNTMTDAEKLAFANGSHVVPAPPDGLMGRLAKWCKKTWV